MKDKKDKEQPKSEADLCAANCSAIQDCLAWARSGESTGGPRTQETLKALCAHIDCLSKMCEKMRGALIDKAFWTAGRDVFDRQGWSLEVDEETAIRDVNYRSAKLFPTADAAIDDYLSNAEHTQPDRNTEKL